ncbi:PLP-dependent transferase [Aulographum hederae CBS 113979]|uniref:PLP-dependent transferase n=1 Tax=Aulographum hederae CBS 113979 TaxID=1176131 RepID=A0A6G1H0M0_9PEZI|nr:PLP-dependent transferase [Aulographum hederae CBS 113979]
MAQWLPPAAASEDAKPLINLLRGWPNYNLLPVALLKEATAATLADTKITYPALEYGPDWGYQPLRESIANWTTAYYPLEEPNSSDRIAITGGASQNLACMLQVFTDPVYTRNIWCIAPAYFLAFRIFDDSGFSGKLRAVPEDDEGIDIEWLRQEIEKSEKKAQEEGNNKPIFKSPRPWSKIYRHVIYGVPTFSNPSSKTMTLLRRQQLVRLAREYDALIITDDVYDFLQWPSERTADTKSLKAATQPRIVDVDRFLDGGAEREGSDGFGNAASNGSFSKICGPGLRTGWVESTVKFAHGVSQTGSSRSGGAPSHFTSTHISHLLETGQLQSYITDTLRPAYASRYRRMMAAIEKHLLPLGVRLPQSDRDIVG